MTWKEFMLENCGYETELALVLNHKIWQHADRNNNLAHVYDELWRKIDHWCCTNLKDDDLSYYYQTTD